MTDARVEVDTRNLERDARKLADRIDARLSPTALSVAEGVANRLRPLIPVHSGALRDTVDAQPIPHGAQVLYGTDLDYAGYIARRTGAVGKAIAGSDRAFVTSCKFLASQEVGRI